MSKSPFGKVDTVNDYPSLFKPALLCTKPGGWLLATNNVASVDEKHWIAQLQRSATKAGVTLSKIVTLRPEKDFPSPDQKWPLKIVLCKREI